MKRAIVLTLAAMFIIGLSASADTNFITLKTGLNLMAASLVPYDPTPSNVFRLDTKDGNGNFPTIPINASKLQKFNTATGMFQPYVGAAFGNILLGSGYVYNNNTGSNIYMAYTGVPNGVPDSNNKKTDMWISMPNIGNQMIGNPFNEAILWANCLMTDGNSTVGIVAAKAAPYSWWSGNLNYFNNSTGIYQPVLTTGTGSASKLQPNWGYVLQTNVPNLALIIPANTP